MTQTITVDSIARESIIPRESVEWVEYAYLGEVGSGKMLIHDSSGTVTTPGHKTVVVTQDAAGTAYTSRLYTGYVGEKQVSRGEYAVGAARWVEVQLHDLNTLLSRKIIYDTDGKRSAETVSDRLTWLLASDYLTGLVSDFGAVSYATAVGMDANDYRGQKPGDVLAAMAKKAQFNYYVRWHAGSAAPELVFRDDNAGTADASTLRISNVAADVDSSVTFAPHQDAMLKVNPDDVYSGVYSVHAKGAVYETRAATGTAFVERDGSADDSGNKTAAAARVDAENFLWWSHLEEHLLTLTLRLPAAKVNLIRAGDRIQVKLSHLATEGYGDFTWFRVLRRKVTQPLNTDNDYDMELDLSPQEDGPPAAVLVQRVSARSGEGGATLAFPNPVTVGNMLILACGDRVEDTPPAPNTAADLPRFGASAWTKLPNTTNVDNYGSGVAIWYKVADSTSQTGYVGQSGSNMVLYEVAGITATGATTADETLQAANTTMSLGSLGTVTNGAFCVAVILWSDQRYSSSPGMPTVSPVTGWTTDRFDSAYEGGAIAENEPFVWIGHAFGEGAALTASITRSGSLVLAGIWAGAALVMEPV